jgi:hypothetical protein
MDNTARLIKERLRDTRDAMLIVAQFAGINSELLGEPDFLSSLRFQQVKKRRNDLRARLAFC